MEQNIEQQCAIATEQWRLWNVCVVVAVAHAQWARKTKIVQAKKFTGNYLSTIFYQILTFRKFKI